MTIYDMLKGMTPVRVAQKTSAGAEAGIVRRRVAAFTLLEFLLAVLMLAGGISWLLYADFLSIRSAKENLLHFQITKGVLEYQLEVLRGLPFNDPALNVGPPVPFTSPIMDPPSVDDPAYGIYNSIQWAAPTASYTVQAITPELKQVVVTVVWTDPLQRQRTDRLSTLISKSGLTNP